MGKKYFILLTLAVLFTVTSQVLFKYGFINEKFGLNIHTVRHILITPIVIMSIILYFAGFAIRSKVVVSNEISIVLPLSSSIAFILTLIYGYILFNESINAKKVLGICFIITGIVMLQLKKVKI